MPYTPYRWLCYSMGRRQISQKYSYVYRVFVGFLEHQRKLQASDASFFYIFYVATTRRSDDDADKSFPRDFEITACVTTRRD